jgi:hypothetical protein
MKRSSSPSSSSISSTPTKILSAKFDYLDQQWNAHKALSPSPIRAVQTKTNKKESSSKTTHIDATTKSASNNNNDNRNLPYSKRRSKPSPGDRGIENHRNDRSSQRRHNSLGVSNDDEGNDNDSVGGSTVSTLSSTESVFDRLHRRGAKKSSSSAPHQELSSRRNSSHDNNRTSSNNITGSSSSSNSFVSPTKTVRARNNRKDHLGAYCNRSTVSDTRSLGYTGDKTPQRGTRNYSSLSQRSFVHHNDTSSDGSTLSGGSAGFDNSVFARLHRNEKRTEKLWKKPSPFTPELSPSTSKRKSRTTAVDHKPSLSHQPKYSHQNEQRNLIEEKDSVADKIGDFEFCTTLEEDLEAINQIGRQLGEVEGCSPTVAASSISSIWEETSHNYHFNHQHNNLTSPVIDQFKRITMATPSVEQEVTILEFVGKQLEKMEANQQEFIISSAHSSNKSSSQNVAATIEQKALLAVDPINVICTLPNKMETTVNNDRIIPTSNDTDSTTTTGTDNYGFFTLEQPSRSFSMDPPSSHNYFFAERIDRLSVPIRRRNRLEVTCDGDYIKMKYENYPILTPRRLRGGACITIQRAWRVHRSELQLAATMIQSWNSSIHFYDKSLADSSIRRQRALQKAIRTVKCWWVLEGLNIEDDWITIAWENEVRIGDAMVQVNFNCEAKSLRVSSNWQSLKLVVLLVKAGLKEAIRGEEAAQRLARWYKQSKGKLHKNATILQLWFRNCRKMGRCRYDEQLEDEESASPVSSKDTASLHDNSYDSSVASLNLREEVLCEIPSPTKNPVSNASHSHEEHVAAIKIQSFLRIAALKSAVKECPSTINQLRAALKIFGSNDRTQLTSFDEFDAARNILCSTMIAQHLSGTQCSWGGVEHNMVSQEEFISQRAAALAIHNIVRAYLTGLKKYKDKKRATLIQATFRGYIARKRIELQDLSAVVIQFAWSNRRYISIKAKNAKKIQRFFRMRNYQRNYEMLRFCIIFIQAGWRRAIARRRLKLLRSSTILVQRTWKGSRERKPYMNFRLAIMTMQYMFQIRRTIAVYQEECCSAVAIQTWWRMHSARLLLLRSLKAASCLQLRIRCFVQCKKFRQTKLEIVKIQRNWRKYICMKLLQVQKSAAICLQTFWRSYLSIESANRRRQSILSIQIVYRGHRCQNLLVHAVISVTKLQTHWRRHRDQVMFLNHIKAVTVLQTFTRTALLRRQFLAYCRASVDIQRFFRGFLCRQLVSYLKEEARKELVVKQLNGAIVVQKMWRMSRERHHYSISLRSTILLQNFQRKILAQSLYKKKLESGRVIQSWLQGILEESRTKTLYLASIEIQRAWRVALAKNCVEALRHSNLISSSILIQSIWRGSKACGEYTEIRNAIITIQAYVRGMLATKCIERLINDRIIEEACISVQRQWRGALARENYDLARVSAIAIQASIRGMLAMKCIERLANDRVTEEACISVQRQWRGALARENYELALGSGIIIQASVRRALASKITKELKYEKTTTKASVLIQSNWREALVRGSYNEARASIITIQSSVRRALASKATKMLAYAKLLENDEVTRVSAIKIQALIRRALASTLKKELKHERVTEKASILLQTNWRAAIARGYYDKIRASIIIIQTSTRRMKSLKIVKALRYERSANKSIALIRAITIQTACRRMLASKRYSEARVTAILIQSAVRGMLAIKFTQGLRYERAIKSSILIQSHVRGAIARTGYSTMRVAVIFIQASVRGMLTLKFTQRSRFETAIKSSILIQSNWRGVFARIGYSEARVAAISIQSAVRGMLALKFTQRSRYERAIKSSILIQSHVRGAIARIRYGEARVAAISIQSVVRGMLALKFTQRSRYERAIKSSILIQSHVRGAIARIRYGEARVAAISIQSAVRGMLALKFTQGLRYERAIKFSVLIQSHVRGAIAHIRYGEARVAAISIQSAVRGMLALKFTQRSRYERAIKSSILIQSHVRGAIARIRYGEARVAAISIQACFRGRMVRKRFDDKRMAELNASIHIQRVCRGAATRLKLNKLNELQHVSNLLFIIKMQSFVRGSLTRKRISSHHQHIAPRTILRVNGNDQTSQAQEHSYHNRMVKSSVSIQRTWRAGIARDMFHRARIAATSIQRGFRAHQTRLRRQSFQVSIILIQCMIRGSLARIQLYRHHIAAIEHSRYQKAAELSIVIIQSYWRASQARDTYCRHRVAAMTIQAMIRGSHIRSQWGFVRLLSTKKNVLDESARNIQISYIVWRMDIAVWEMRSLAVLLQRGIRGQLSRSVVQYALLHLNSSYHSMIVNSYDRLVADREQGLPAILAWNRALSQARVSVVILIQSFMRGIIVRNLIREKFGLVFDDKLVFAKPTTQSQSAAIAIQRAFHTWSQFRNFYIVIIQKSIRRWIAWRKFHDTFLVIRAATKIQTFQRCLNRRYRFFQQKQFAIKIQSLWRKILARNSLIISKTASCLIQKAYRIYQNHKKRRIVLVARRLAVERQQLSIRQGEVALDQISSETRVASAIIVENLLLRRELMTYGPCLTRLANRVNYTLNENDLSSRQIFPDFVHRNPVVIPLPNTVRRPESSALCTKPMNIRTPVRCKKSNPKSEKSTCAGNDLIVAKPLPSISSTSSVHESSGLFKTPERVIAAAAAATTSTDDIGKNRLAKQAKELMIEARKAMRKNRKLGQKKSVMPLLSGGDVSPNRQKETATRRRTQNNNTVYNNDSLENFGGAATMPSPIKEEKSDWDWISGW